jgi:hypothetical protein
VISRKTFVWNFSHSKKSWAGYNKKSSSGLHLKYPSFLSYFDRKNSRVSDFMKSFSVGAEFSMRTEGRADMTKLIVAFAILRKCLKLVSHKLSSHIVVTARSRVQTKTLAVSHGIFRACYRFTPVLSTTSTELNSAQKYCASVDYVLIIACSTGQSGLSHLTLSICTVPILS